MNFEQRITADNYILTNCRSPNCIYL